MKVLCICFYGKYNASNILLDTIEAVDKLVLTNSFSKLEKELMCCEIEAYNLILMFGINKNLTNEIRLEKVAEFGEVLYTKIDIEKIHWICQKRIKSTINEVPTTYLCNRAYYHVLKRNGNACFIHIPGMSKLKDFRVLNDVVKDIIRHFDLKLLK